MADWTDLYRELAHWSGAGRRPGLWWRDDDAVAPGPHLETLTELSKTSGVPVGLAVIPGRAKADLGGAVADVAGLKMLVHGWRHQNNAPADQKKAEFGAHRPAQKMLDDAANSRQSLAALFPDLALPVFVPPWNRVDEQLVARLPLSGLTALSRFGRRGAPHAPDGAPDDAPDDVLVGPLECNCHLDLIDWRGGRGFIGRARALDSLIEHLQARRSGHADYDETTGILTHHDVMDRQSWDFLAELFDRTQESDSAHWLTIDEVFRLPQ